MGTGKFNAGGNPAMDLRPIQGGDRNTPSRLMPQKPELSAQSDGPPGLNTDFTLPNTRG